jgi:hypothetical protein
LFVEGLGITIQYSIKSIGGEVIFEQGWWERRALQDRLILNIISRLGKDIKMVFWVEATKGIMKCYFLV